MKVTSIIIYGTFFTQQLVNSNKQLSRLSEMVVYTNNIGDIMTDLVGENMNYPYFPEEWEREEAEELERMENPFTPDVLKDIEDAFEEEKHRIAEAKWIAEVNDIQE